MKTGKIFVSIFLLFIISLAAEEPKGRLYFKIERCIIGGCQGGKGTGLIITRSKQSYYWWGYLMRYEGSWKNGHPDGKGIMYSEREGSYEDRIDVVFDDGYLDEYTDTYDRNDPKKIRTVTIAFYKNGNDKTKIVKDAGIISEQSNYNEDGSGIKKYFRKDGSLLKEMEYGPGKIKVSIKKIGPGLTVVTDHLKNEITITENGVTRTISKEEYYFPKLKSLSDSDIEEGKKIFDENCAACHGPEGKGNIGPDLTDNVWLHGGDLSKIHDVITNGIILPDEWKLGRGPMPAFENIYGTEADLQVERYLIEINEGLKEKLKSQENGGEK